MKNASRNDKNVKQTAAIEAEAENDRSVRVSAKMSFEAPFPPPATLAGYAEIDPSIPMRIMEQFEKDCQHVREMEELSTKAAIEQNTRGQNYAMILAILILGIVGYAIHTEQTWVAGIAGVAFLVVMVSAFLKQYK